MILITNQKTMKVIERHCGHEVIVQPNIVGTQITCLDCDQTVARLIGPKGQDKPGFPVFHNLPLAGINATNAHCDCNLSLSKYPGGELVVACEDHHEVLVEFQSE